MHFQNCPVCFRPVDVRIYVTGQKARCTTCGNKFVVERSGPGRNSLDGTQSEKTRKGTPAATPAVSSPETRPDRRAGSPPLPATPPPQPPAPPPAPAAPTPDTTQAGPAPAASPAPIIPGYTRVEMLGQGAMGSVWKAREDASGDPVAIKILVEHLAKSNDFILRFDREAKAMEAVKHPYVVRMKARGSHSGLHFIVMEYVDGQPIRREMERTNMPAARAVAICRRVARGLEAAHKVGIVHRDLKPENVLLSATGEIKIVDFGLAALFSELDPAPNLTRSRITMGTWNYMAPEQRTDAKRVDRRADIYSLGVMLFEMLTRQTVQGRFLLPVERGMALPPLVDEILRKALSNEASQRHQSAAELDTELAQLEKELQAPAQPDDPSKRRWWPFA
ncbi:MAG: serine/threonine protein kinase [Deltaproteobacteria bacterium]|nr:serine/threonine protein kinase [Deltaproteobacteria bacterium]